MPSQPDHARDERLKKLHGSGMEAAIIRERLGITTSTYNAMCRRLGLKRSVAA